MQLTNWCARAPLACLLCAILASGCATDRARLAAAEQAKAQLGAIDEAATLGAASEPLPPQPPDCRQKVGSGVRGEDRVDVALVKQDRALGRANALLAACAQFYEGVRASRGGR